MEGNGIFSYLNPLKWKKAKPITNAGKLGMILGKDPKTKAISFIFSDIIGPLTGYGLSHMEKMDLIKEKHGSIHKFAHKLTKMHHTEANFHGEGILSDLYRNVANYLWSNPDKPETIMRKGEIHAPVLKFDFMRTLKLKSPFYLENSPNIGPGTDEKRFYETGEDWKEYTKNFTEADKSSLMHDLRYMRSKNEHDTEIADEKMSSKLLNNVSVFHPIESVNNLIFGSAIKGKEILDKTGITNTNTFTKFNSYDKLNQEEKKNVDKLFNGGLEEGYGKKKKRKEKK